MTLVLLLLVVAWVAVPFAPAVHEARRRRAAAPLPIAPRYAEDRAEGPDASAPPEPGDLVADAAGRLDAADDGQTVTAGTFFHGPDGRTYDTLRIRGIGRLGAGSTVHSRLVAGDTVEVGPGCRLAGSAQAGEALDLGAGCRFERVHAPTITTGDAPPWAPRMPRPAAVWAPPARAEVAGGRALVRGDLALPAGTLAQGDLVVTGALTLGAGARVDGDVKAHGPLTLGPGAVVNGHAFSRSDVTLGASAVVHGVAAAEGTLTLATGARVGRLTAPSTATGRHVVLGRGVRVYGTVWAIETGRVEG